MLQHLTLPQTVSVRCHSMLNKLALKERKPKDSEGKGVWDSVGRKDINKPIFLFVESKGDALILGAVWIK